MSVAPRWKRRADEIAEAIGDELSINGTVSIGNDVNLSVATISALAKAITDVLNPNAISRAIWTDEASGTHVATVVSPVSGESLPHWLITLNGASVIRVFQLWAYDNSYQIPATQYSLGTAFGVVPNASPPYRNEFRLPSSNINNVTVVTTNTTPVHVQVRNIAGGFTAMGSDISTSMKLSAQPVSIADTVDVKTATGEAVAITGTVNANVGGVTLPISNPNNITVPVVNSGNVTIPVSLGGVTVPVRASANGTPQNSSGVNVLVSVNPTHSVTVPVSVGSATVPVSVPSGITVPASVGSNLTVPVSVGSATVPVSVSSGTTVPASVASNLTVPVSVGSATVPVSVSSGVTVPASVPSGLTVPVAVGSNTVPVAVGSATVPVANTNSVVVPVENSNNVTVPVTSSGTTLDVNIKTIDVNARTQFHEAMETALNEATDINTIEQAGFYYGTVISHSTTYVRVKDVDGGIYDAGVVIISGTNESVMRSTASALELNRMVGVRVATESSDYKTTPRTWRTVESFPGGLIDGTVSVDQENSTLNGTVHWTGTSGTWSVIRDDGIEVLNQVVYHNKVVAQHSNSTTIIGIRVVKRINSGWWQTIG